MTIEPATPLCDEEFSYQTGLPAGPAACRLRAFKRADGSVVAVATDTDQGPSVTNAAEWLWAAVRVRLGLEPGVLLYSFEHYPHPGKDETWDRVIPKGYHPEWGQYEDTEWRPFSKVGIEELIGHRL